MRSILLHRMNISRYRLMMAIMLVVCLIPLEAVKAQVHFLGEIIEVGYNFCPVGTTEANGQLLAISSNDALFSLYGTTYGGDGRTTFALPDLRGRKAIGAGTGAGLSTYNIGAQGGVENVTLTPGEVPSHSHTIPELTSSQGSDPGLVIRQGGGATTEDTGLTGGSQSHFNVPPYLVIRYCVATIGTFPSRN